MARARIVVEFDEDEKPGWRALGAAHRIEEETKVFLGHLNVSVAIEERGILPGDLVDRRGTDLDSREVIAVGRDWLTLDILGEETERLPLDNYEVAVPREGRL